MVDNILDLREKVQIMCMYYASLKSTDKDRNHITKKYRELSKVSGIKEATIRQWTDSFDPYFDNGRKGYHQRPLESSNKSLFNIFTKYKDLAPDEMKKLVTSIELSLKELENNKININKKLYNIFSIKTSNEKAAYDILDNRNIIEIDGLNWYADTLSLGDIIFVVLGGDRKPWENGLVGIAKVIKEPFDLKYKKNNYKILIELKLLLTHHMKPDDFYYYPLVKDVINIGPSTKGVPNQAINRVPLKACISIIRAILDNYSEYETSLTELFDEDILRMAKGYVPILGEQITDFHESAEPLSDSALPSSDLEPLESDDEIDQELKTDSDYTSFDDRLDYNTEIRVDKGFYTVYELKRKYDRNNKLKLDSDFQRNAVWKLDQKVELIESILMGIPLPIFYFNEDKYGNLIVVDGRQRLTALFEFIDNKYLLNKMKVMKKYNGCRFSDLNMTLQTRIEDYQLQAHVILPPTDDQIKFHIFDRVNRAGTQLNKQEIRNALYQGNSTKLLNKVCENPLFGEATDQAFEKNKRMQDRYILLRYISFELYFSNQIENGKFEYKNSPDELLGKSMECLNTFDKNVIKQYETLCYKGLKNAIQVLGKDAFRLKRRRNGRRPPINMNIFETLMFLMVRVDLKTPDNIIFLRERIAELLDDENYQDSIGSYRDNLPKIKKRFGMVNDILKELNDAK
ncbi:hypothetical protein ENLAB_17230 [Enterococcus innesii]|uniref:GmrSD restriction endonucleases N-terminal domain-containing protein n=1 Tax=Enterococcus innesii TaxID=2839759 RepID=A0ABN6NTF5_9ENTE|nr:DUF262 domain-containing protein [Enterococcus innesii]BDG68159.1 hypothetical protein ENLAB_17230 [Enterococcus innesii]